ncbi:MAG: preprotein translocase subunit SecG [Spirochaetaceae bacterium]
MGLLSIVLLVIFALVAILMVILVLLQDEGGEGLGGIFGGGGMSQQGGRRSGNILTRATSVLGALFLVIAFTLAWVNRTPESGDVEQAARELEGGGSGVEWWRTEADDEESGSASESGEEQEVDEFFDTED